MTIKIWLFVVLLVVALIVGLVVGFFVARTSFKKYMQKHPPVTESMVRAMMNQMGRKPSEKQVRAVMATLDTSTKQ